MEMLRKFEEKDPEAKLMPAMYVRLAELLVKEGRADGKWSVIYCNLDVC